MTDYIDLTTQPRVVIDNGSGVIKAGLAGDDQPKFICPSYVGRVKHERVMTGGLKGDFFMGEKAQEHRGLLSIRYPMEHGIIEDWDDMDKLWSYVYSKDGLGVQAEECPLLLTEAPNNPKQNREKAAEKLFEVLSVPALCISMQAVLSLYASGRTTGVVLDSGDGVTHAVPVYEGFAIKHAIRRVDLAGRDVSRHLQLLLRREGHIFKTSAEFEIVKTIKEEACYVSTNPQKDEGLDDRSVSKKYILPDKTEITLKHSRFRAPEILFDPTLIGEECDGVHQVLHNAIRKSDLELRKTLYSSIILSGGNTKLENFATRLMEEMKKVSPKGEKIKLMAPTERQYSTWMGGSILASLDSFRQMWVTKKEYDENGPNAIHRKSFL